jgi:hypothetical protein
LKVYGLRISKVHVGVVSAVLVGTILINLVVSVL